MKAVVNTSPLIFLAKLGKLSLLDELFSAVFVPDDVADEALKGVEKGYRDALLIKAKLEKGELKRKRVDGKRGDAEKLGLHRDELSVLLLAKDMNVNIVIVDDYAAIKAAKYFGLKPYSTPFILLKALKEGKMHSGEFRSSLDKLLELGYHISPRLYVLLLEKARKR